MPERHPSRRWDSVPLWVGLAAVLVWLWQTGPWMLGERTPIQRDVILANVHYKAYGAQQLAAGKIPAINTAWGLGQPFRGNPGTLPFYPGNLLYLALPFWAAFGGHYALHWLLAGAGMWLLSRRLGYSSAAAVLAALTYSGGLVISAVSFYNTLAVLAWWPWVLAGVVGRPSSATGRRTAFEDPAGFAAGALACGLAGLGGEPLALVLLAPTAFLLGWGLGRRIRDAFSRAAAMLGLGALLSMPQIVATLRVLPFSGRGGPGVGMDPSHGFTLEWTRLLEFLMPYPFGIPFRFDAWGYWATQAPHQYPYFYELFAGVLTVPLVALAARRRPLWSAWVVAGLFVACRGGEVTWLSSLSFGMFRHPEKFLLWTAPLLPLLAAEGVDRLRAGTVRGVRLFLVLALVPALALAAITLGFERFVSWQAARLVSPVPAGVAHAQSLLWIAGLSGLLLGFLAAAWALRRRRAEWLPAIQLASLLSLLPLLPTAVVDTYGRSPLQAGLGDRTAVWSPLHNNLSRLTHPAPRYSLVDLETSSLFMARDLEPAEGVPNGLEYPIVVDLDGLASPLLWPIIQRLAAMPEKEQVNWLRALGVEAIVVGAERRLHLPVLVGQASPDGDVLLQAVEDPMPPLLWPSSFEVASSVGDAYVRVGESPDPVARPVLLRAAEQGELRALELSVWEPDRIVFDIDSGGGVVVLRRSFQPLYRAYAEGPEGRADVARILANATLLALRVPAGRQRVTVEVSAAPEWWGVVVSLATLVALATWLLWCRARRASDGDPSDRPGLPPGVTSATT